MDAALAEIGHNNPPADPFDAFTAHIGDLFEEAKNFLDGEGVKTEGQADSVAKLLDLIRTASKDADKARSEEKKPHDEAGKAVQAKWKPLLERADLAVDACKKALAPWLQAKEAERRAAAEAAPKAKAAAAAVLPLADRAKALEATMRKAGTADELRSVWARGSGLCADLDAKDPERLAELEALYATLFDELATPTADEFGLAGDAIPEFA